jgi:hypothetical protein
MHFKDIKPFTRSSSYSVDIGWGFLEAWLENAEKDCADLQLDPEFQRHHVWDDTKRSRYVEYILRGGRSSTDIYFNCANYVGNGKEGPMQLVDGKQRLDAVRRYLRSEIPAFGILFKDMKGTLRMTGPRFKVHINDLQTQREVLQWYLDLNEGGVAHTPDELNKVRAMLLKENSNA